MDGDVKLTELCRHLPFFASIHSKIMTLIIHSKRYLKLLKDLTGPQDEVMIAEQTFRQ